MPLKDLVCGPVCWAKMVHFWKPWKQAFWPPPECREPFNVLPRHALSSFMDWNGGVGPWWAATASKKHQALVSASEHKLIRQTMPDELFNKTQPIRLTREGCQLCRQIFEWLNLVYFINRAQQNNRDPKRFSGCLLIKTRTFPCQKGVQNRTLTPDPRTFKMSSILLQTPLVSCWHQRGAFGNPLSGRDFHPAHLYTSRHKLSMQSCSVKSSLRSCILRSGWELWGKNSHRNGWPDF